MSYVFTAAVTAIIFFALGCLYKQKAYDALAKLHTDAKVASATALADANAQISSLQAGAENAKKDILDKAESLIDKKA